MATIIRYRLGPAVLLALLLTLAAAPAALAHGGIEADEAGHGGLLNSTFFAQATAALVGAAAYLIMVWEPRGSRGR